MRKVGSRGERPSIEDRHNSKIREDLSDIRGVLKQPPDVTTVIRMARCEISCQKTKLFETKPERISCLKLESRQCHLIFILSSFHK